MKLVRWSLILSIILLIAAILNRAYIVFGVMAMDSGCRDAAKKLGIDYGPKYETYMKEFCSARLGFYKTFILKELKND